MTKWPSSECEIGFEILSSHHYHFEYAQNLNSQQSATARPHPAGRVITPAHIGIPLRLGAQSDPSFAGSPTQYLMTMMTIMKRQFGSVRTALDARCRSVTGNIGRCIGA